MSSYLELAEVVLASVRRPMSARSILRVAHQQGLVPDHLYGRTQHKTLQARLSEDILNHRERSLFCRTAPGKFFLRKLLSDDTIPAEFRREIRARRRTRDLLRGPALGIDASCLGTSDEGEVCLPAKSFLRSVLEQNCFDYVEPKDPPETVLLVWAVVTVRRNHQVLTYRTGRYRDDRDTFAHRRSLCFAGLVSEADRNLFDWTEFGIAECGLNAVSTDLNVPIDGHYDADQVGQDFSVAFDKVIKTCRSGREELLAVIEVVAPSWFEPTAGRLSINDLRWMDCSSRPNHLDDFDPWSQTLMSLKAEVDWRGSERFDFPA